MWAYLKIMPSFAKIQTHVSTECFYKLKGSRHRARITNIMIINFDSPPTNEDVSTKHPS